MTESLIDFSRKEKRTIIFAVTIGNLLEWYEIYLYVYWAPIISKLFFDSGSSSLDLAHTYLVFAMGFLSRPIGGIFFGRLGDRIGRRAALVLSIAMMTVPTFVTGLLPTYAQIGTAAPFILCAMRILQSFPAGGELPGAFCYLYESAPLKTRRFMSSWSGMGYQLGILISTVECFALEKFLSTDALISWGWRFSFLIGGVLGLLGLFLRYKLHETPVYREMHTHVKVTKEPLLGVLNQHKKGILFGITYCALNSSAFYLISANFPTYFSNLIGTDYSNNLLVTVIILLIISIPLPLFGYLADHFDNRKMLLGSVGGTILILFPLYLTIQYNFPVVMGLLLFLFCMFFTCLTALIPYAISELFPTRVRFTCVGLSFNLADAIIGGFTPFLAMQLLSATGNQASFCLILLGVSIISFIGYYIMKEKHAIH